MALHSLVLRNGGMFVMFVLFDVIEHILLETRKTCSSHSDLYLYVDLN